jgi:hypothetical protein
MKRSKMIRQNILVKTGGIFFILVCLFISQGCATIAGGGNYYAHVAVEDHPFATIKHNDIIRGQGKITIKVPRKEANSFVLTISEPGCPTIERKFNKRVFRGWAFVGTIVTWTGLTVNGGAWLPVPFGLMVDGPTGALWKPDVTEDGVVKIDYKNFHYTINYPECDKALQAQEKQ